MVLNIQTTIELLYIIMDKLKKQTNSLEENELLFNIVVPLFKAEKYIEKCLNSILKQSYKKLN